MRVPTILSSMAAAALTASLLVPTTSANAAAPGSTAAGIPRCDTTAVTASYRDTDAGAGHRYGRLVLRNTSDGPCRTGGYGGLSYVGGGDGTQVGAPADRDPGRERLYTLQPGQRLISEVDRVVAQNFPRKRCRPTAVDGFRVYVSGETRSQFVPYRTTGCANPNVHLLSHTPYARP